MILRNEFWVAILVLLAAAMLLVVHLSSNDSEFSRYNEGWNGTSAFFSSLDRHRAIMITEPGQLAQYGPNATLLVIAPARNPSTDELDAYRTFLDRGNTLVIADDFGTGGRILAGLSSHITSGPGPLASIDREFADPYSVVAYPSADGNLVEKTGCILLNAPASLEGGTPLLRTSVFSWADMDRDRHIGSSEVLGMYTVMATDQHGQGTIIALADPSIFINAMEDPGQRCDNRRLISRLTGTGSPVLIDQMNSRTRDAAGLGELLHVMKTTVLIETLALGLLVLAVAAVWRRRIL